MKNFYTLLLFLIAVTTQSQIINFPDANFKAKLLEAGPESNIAFIYNIFIFNYISVKIDTNNDGEIQVAEAENIQGLDVNNSMITDLTGIEFFTNLLFLNCRNNQLTSIDVSQNTNLQSLGCSDNLLTSLDVTQNTNLQLLHCYNNQLTSLDVTQNVNLQSLNCTGNQLTSLDVSQNVNLVNLDCGYNQLTSLDVTQNTNLLFLICNGNQITNLNLSQNVNLQHLYCNNNQLTGLNLSQNVNLRTLYSHNNQLTSLDLSQNVNLQTLHCNYNELISLDVSQNTNLTYMHCSNNQLTTIFAKNGNSLWVNLSFENNTNLQYICVDDEDVEWFQQIINTYGYTNCLVNSYCSFTPGGTFYTINGENRFDENANGCETSDISLPNLKIGITNSSISGAIIANDSGNYFITVSADSHTITPIIENPTYFSVSPASVAVTFPDTASPFAQNFCLTANGSFPDLEITLVPTFPARPGFDAPYKLVFKNKGTATQNATITLSFQDDVLDFLQASPAVNSQSNGSLSWNITNLAPFETREINLSFNVNSPMETPAVNGGDILNYTATITSTTDTTPDDNTFALAQTVVNSFDPNDKTCLEGSVITPAMVGDYVHYLIRFENTGTFAAQNVVIRDDIDVSKFDIATLVPLSSSHSFFTRIQNGNRVEFIFENINLPFEDATNDGYVLFKIKTKPNLVIGDTFTNKAGIYFDFNFPIITNTTSTTVQLLGNQDFVFNEAFVLAPNPVKDILSITAKDGLSIQSLHIYNTIGQLLEVQTQPDATLNVAHLPKGNYVVKINTNKGTTATKFVKE